MRPARRPGCRVRSLAAAGILAAASLSACAADPPLRAQPLPVAITAAPIAASTHAAVGVQATLLDEARTFVFRARNESCLTVGTAFATQDEIVTNRHVVAGAATLDLSTWAGQDFSAEVTGHDESEDLALLEGIPPEDHFASLAASDPIVGTPVYVAGYPLGDQLTVTSGKVLGTTGGGPLGIAGQVLDISDPVQHGNSGSPLLDSAGQVVGVVFALDTASHDGLAMPVSALRALLGGAAVDSSTLACADL